MRFLVTGATGFIGSHLCRRLVERGDSVTALVRNPAKLDALPIVDVLEGDLSIFEQEDLALPAFDVVVHLAGIVAGRSEQHYWDVNYQAVVDLIRCLERQSWSPKRFLFASSLAAGGPSLDGKPNVEADEPRPIEAYGRAKAKAEAFLRDNAPFPTTSFRPALVFGAGDPASLTLFKIASRGLGFEVGGASQGLSFVDVSDLVIAIERMAEDDTSQHRTYYVSHPSMTNQAGLWKAIGDALGRRVTVATLPRSLLWLAMVAATSASRLLPVTNQLDDKQYRQMTAPGWICDSSALSNELGWKAEHDLAAAVARAAEGYRQLGVRLPAPS